MNPAKKQALAPTGRDVAAGQVLGRYELLVPIAAGGMAMVWAARMKGTRGFQKIVAVKTMLPKLSDDLKFEQMFLDEAQLASKVRHPHVVEILDLGEQEGVLYLVMEWIEGVPLNQLMKAAKRQKGTIPLSIAVRIVMQACAGLHAAHELSDDDGKPVGLVHRDVSPQNILVTFDGVAKVVDFGVAKATAIGDGATGAGQIKGKVGYMAPEQVKGDDLDRRVDVFAMGIVLYALTTGKHPFRRDSDAATMYNIASMDPAVAPSKAVPEYPEALEKVVLKAIAKDRKERFGSTNALLRALDALPASLRGATDADVGAFVRELLGDERDRQRKDLSQALERADAVEQSAAGQHQTTSGLVPALPLVEHASSPAVAGDDAIRRSDGFGQGGATKVDAPPRPRTGRWAVLGALVLAAAAIGYFVTTQIKPTADFQPKREVMPEGSDNLSQRGKSGATETDDSASAPSSSAPALDLGSLPVEKPKSSADPAPPKPPQRTQRPPRRPTKPRKEDNSWKLDPGF